MSSDLDKLAKERGIDTDWKPTETSLVAMSDEDTVSEATKGSCDIFAQVLRNLQPNRWLKAKRIRGARADDSQLDHVYLCSANTEVDIYGVTNVGGIEDRFKAKGYSISTVEEVELQQIDREYTEAQLSICEEQAVFRTSLREALCKRFERFIEEHRARFS